MHFDQQRPRCGFLLYIILLWVLSSSAGFAQTDNLQANQYEYEYKEPYDYRPSAAVAKVFDAVIVRPVMVGVSVFSLGAFVGSLPFTATGVAGIDVSTARKNFVSYPLNFTFKRPLGDFSAQE